MKFVIRFEGTLAQIPNRLAGLWDLDFLRTELDAPGLTPENVMDEVIGYMQFEAVYELTETQARLIAQMQPGAFAHTGLLRVSVANNGAEQFVYYTAHATHIENDRIKCARVGRCLDIPAMYAAWVIDGAPLRWKPKPPAEYQK